MLNIGPDSRKRLGDAFVFLVWGGVMAEGVRTAIRSKRTPHAVLQNYEQLFRAYSFLHQDMSGLLDLENEAAVGEILLVLEEMRKEDVEKKPGSEWRLARHIASALTRAKQLIDDTRCVDASSDLCTMRLVAKEHVLPSLREHLDTVLHNHLLSVSTH